MESNSFYSENIGTGYCNGMLFMLLLAELQKQVIQIVGHLNCIAVAYNHCICVLQLVTWRIS